MSDKVAEASIIYLVDDDDDARDLCAALLRMAGLNVRDFGTAEDALVALETERPDMVVMDIHLNRGMNGYQAAALVRERSPNTYVVAMTGDPTYEVKKRGELFDAILRKPAEVDELLAILRKLGA